MPNKTWIVHQKTPSMRFSKQKNVWKTEVYINKGKGMYQKRNNHTPKEQYPAIDHQRKAKYRIKIKIIQYIKKYRSKYK